MTGSTSNDLNRSEPFCESFSSGPRMLFSAISSELRGRVPFYRDDFSVSFQSGANIHKTLTASLFTIISSITPAIAFASYLVENTGSQWGVQEVLLSTAIGGILYSLLAGQPLVIVGVTGPISIFSRATYALLGILTSGTNATGGGATKGGDTTNDASQARETFLPFMFWVSFWAAWMHMALAAGNGCHVVRWVQRFSYETFGALIAVIYIYTGIQQMIHVFQTCPLATGLLALLVTSGTLLLALLLAGVRTSTLYTRWFRAVIADYSVVVVVIVASLIPWIPQLREVAPLPLLPVPALFQPSNGRASWLIDPLALPTSMIFMAIPAALLLTILIYFDHNVSSLIAQDPSFGLKKPSAYNYDFFLIGAMMLVTGWLGLPPTHGLIPQAPLHAMQLVTVVAEEEEVTVEEEEKVMAEEAKVVVEEEKGKLAVRRDNVVAAVVVAPLMDSGSSSSDDRTVSKQLQNSPRSGSLGQNATPITTTITTTTTAIVKTKRTVVLEQRVSNLLQSLVTLMTVLVPWILSLFGRIPIAVLSGIFLVLGFQSLEGNSFVERLFVLGCVTDPDLRYRAAPSCWWALMAHPVSMRKIALFTGLQLLALVVVFLVMEVASPYVAMTFPAFLTAIIAIPFILGRCRFLGRWQFDAAELAVLDGKKKANKDGVREHGASAKRDVEHAVLMEVLSK